MARARTRVAGIGLLLAVCAGCTSPATPPAPTPEPAPPPAPPAACLLDTAALATATGVSWTPDQTTASDTRCVYDLAAATPTATPDFLAVEIAAVNATDAATELDSVAAVCADGSRAPVQDDGRGFVCRFRGGSVFAAIARAGQLVTVSASGVPQGTTAARLVLALQQQLDGLGG